MTKSIRSYPKNQRHEIAWNRLNGKHKTDGLGHWAAVDYYTRTTKIQEDAQKAGKEPEYLP